MNDKGMQFGEMKQPPKTPLKKVLEAIEDNEIYTEVMKHYFEQIAYGLDKYPETLNVATWDLVEALEHEIGELVDQLNYKVMFKLKLIRLLKEFGVEKYRDK